MSHACQTRAVLVRRVIAISKPPEFRSAAIPTTVPDSLSCFTFAPAPVETLVDHVKKPLELIGKPLRGRAKLALDHGVISELSGLFDNDHSRFLLSPTTPQGSRSNPNRSNGAYWHEDLTPKAANRRQKRDFYIEFFGATLSTLRSTKYKRSAPRTSIAPSVPA
jgi:hypothetical protein